MSSLVDVVLFAALALTSGIALVLLSRLKRLDRYHAEYRETLGRSEAALQAMHDAISKLGAEGREIAVALDHGMREARATLAALDDVRREAELRIVAEGEPRPRVRPYAFARQPAAPRAAHG